MNGEHTEELNSLYGIGDLIVYGTEGVCRVEDIGVPALAGINQERQYYTLKPLYREGRIYAPVDTAMFMRPVITRDDADALIRDIEALTDKVPGCTDAQALLDEYYGVAPQKYRKGFRKP